MNELKPAVLVVEDNQDDVIFLEHALNGKFNIRIVGTLAAAVKVLTQSVPQVILLDLELPDSHFPDTLNRILAVAVGATIVIVSGRGDEAFVQQCLVDGAHGFLSKDRLPFTDVQLELEKAEQTKKQAEIIQQAHHVLQKVTQQKKTL